jgi:hypothetical protein
VKVVKTARISAVRLTKGKHEKIIEAVECFKASVNFLIEKCVENPLFQKVSKKDTFITIILLIRKSEKAFITSGNRNFPRFTRIIAIPRLELRKMC